ncbi:leucine--tRNA ligase [Candidatus Uhrbacteria bacterium]|nr:leucine--tRNA ligase [Candidatus Uhrbacteria bacterium]
MPRYDHQSIERKWQERWSASKAHEARDPEASSGRAGDARPKYYALIEFPYPSGDGLHVGHLRPYVGMDVIARKRRMEGKNVLYPIGWDAFGLPTENYAIKNGIHPRVATERNIANIRRQIQMLGVSFDWSREVNTTDPAYYKWTQWIFLQLLKHGLAYKACVPINWCLSCKIGLANEEAVGGACERCGGPVEKRDREQWMLKITAYAEKLLAGLETVDYIERAKVQQRNWIGRSEGINIRYTIAGTDATVAVFTTRPDTNFGATFIALAPDGTFVREYLAQFPERVAVERYIEQARRQTDIERVAEGRKKTGVFTGWHAVNQLTSRRMPVYVADFVLGTVGTGAVVGVPGHDIRDFEFAQETGLEVIRVVVGPDGDTSPITRAEQVQEDTGTMMNSGFLDGLDIHEATRRIMDHIEEHGWGRRTVTYKLRDWVFSRQRYWGEPIPVVFCATCGTVPVPEDQLPVELPNVEKYQPTDTGDSPLAAITEWVNTKCPQCGGPAKRETDVMPNWAGSSWYFLAYAMRGNPKSEIRNPKFDWDKEKLAYWMPVDWYNGGMEHTTLHLLYSRFWYQFLYDIGAVPHSISERSETTSAREEGLRPTLREERASDLGGGRGVLRGNGRFPADREPYAKRTSHGLILASDGEKMSKSRGNVVNPDEIVEKFGADAVRVYEMFIGPFDQPVPWSTDGLVGCRRFLEKVVALAERVERRGGVPSPPAGGHIGPPLRGDQSLNSFFHRTIKKVTEDIEAMRFNTAVSCLMEYTNELGKRLQVSFSAYATLLALLAPFAPHLCEELWKNVGAGFTPARAGMNPAPTRDSISSHPWPSYDPALIVEDEIDLVIQVNGKLRATIRVPADIGETDARTRALVEPHVVKYLEGKQPKKIIFVPGRLLNIVV